MVPPLCQRSEKRLCQESRRPSEKEGSWDGVGLFAWAVFSHRPISKGQAQLCDRPPVQDEFDLRYGVETSTRVHLTDLKIDSPNWIYAGGYWPTSTEVIHEALSGVANPFRGLRVH